MGDEGESDRLIVPSTSSALRRIPALTVDASPSDGGKWTERLKEELGALIAYIADMKARDTDWFSVDPPTSNGVQWQGRCWVQHDMQRYEFAWRTTLPAAYPHAAPEIELPELEGLTPKMYRGGKICVDMHFRPLWTRNSPRFGLAHVLCLGLGPWLAAEVPWMAGKGLIHPSG